MTDKPLNLLMVHCHDLGQHLGCYGVETVHTPQLDQFAAAGVRFNNSFCTSPGCSPSRAALFTGLYPHTTGVLGLTHLPFDWELNPDITHLAQYLGRAGYDTACFGIMHETHSGPARTGYRIYDSDADAVTATDHALAFLAEHGDPQPFFLCVGYFEPHRTSPDGNPDSDEGFVSPLLQPDSSKGIQIPGYLCDTPGTRGELAELQGAIAHVDQQFGRLLAGVDLSTTVVVFTTDHGIAMPRAKCSLYDPGIEVALLVAGAGVQPAVAEGLISNVDIVPSLLEVLGLPVPEGLHGRSRASTLRGEADRGRDAIFAEMTYHDYYDPRRCIRSETHKLIVNFSSAPAFMNPSQRWHPRSETVVPVNPAMAYHPDVELYDLREDPWEQHNLAGQPQHRDLETLLLQRLEEHLRHTGDPICDGAVTNPHHLRSLSRLTPHPS